ncbi:MULTISPECIES: UxaA family hydrolase [Paenibacillus]|uniref:UxaA family hydrolase n=1 Tax=Paenibacillus TaxID=44249 RepID=UPI0022B85EC2|nr:UxaA family hydrolase [Paenibacillus caseinilyticus]MCZ8524097.1 UxaA family hydrolase [Paenibacillus caseinilyticus]
MAGQIAAGAQALIMDPRDHVATAIKDLAAGEHITCYRGSEAIGVTLLGDVPFGHKVAVEDIPQGTELRKYGEVIGRTTVPIRAGEHVHVHNVEGIRGRGDQAGDAAVRSEGSAKA